MVAKFSLRKTPSGWGWPWPEWRVAHRGWRNRGRGTFLAGRSRWNWWSLDSPVSAVAAFATQTWFWSGSASERRSCLMTWSRGLQILRFKMQKNHSAESPKNIHKLSLSFQIKFLNHFILFNTTDPPLVVPLHFKRNRRKCLWTDSKN